jgi:phosphohistidine phosphatase
MELFLLRHAQAETQGDAWKGADKNRPLSKKGERKMRRVAVAYRHLGLTFDLILSSPYVRARRTAEIVAAKTRHAGKIRFSQHLTVGGNARALVNEIAGEHRDCAKVLLVGHEPALGRLISVLLSGKQSLVVTMKKGAICALSIRTLRYGHCATLEWLMSPAEVLNSK